MTKSTLLAAAAALAMTATAYAQDAEPAAEPGEAAPAFNLVSGTYAIDDSHTVVTWSVKHLGLSLYTAQLETVTGNLTLDVETPANTAITATIDTASVDTDYTGEKDFDAEVVGFLIGQDFQFPTADDIPEDRRFITFTSTGFIQTSPTTGELTGDLTFNGQTHPSTLDVELTGAIDEHPFAGVPAIGIHARGVVSRSDYNVAAGLNQALADDVEIVIAAELLKTD